MAVIATMKVKNPKKVGEFLIINAREFNPAVHEPWTGVPVIETPVVTLPEPRGNDISGYIPPVVDDAAPVRSHHAKAKARR